MRKIYSLRLVGNKLHGELENGQTITVGRVTYFSKHSGLLYSAKAGYVVMSYDSQSEFSVNEFINEQLNEIWV